MTVYPNRKIKDGWISYGIECKGTLINVLGQWKINFTEAKLRVD